MDAFERRRRSSSDISRPTGSSMSPSEDFPASTSEKNCAIADTSSSQPEADSRQIHHGSRMCIDPFVHLFVLLSRFWI